MQAVEPAELPQPLDLLGVLVLNVYIIESVFGIRGLGFLNFYAVMRADRPLVIATTAVPLDHAWSLEVTLLQGDAAEIRDFADALFSERGIRHGRLALVPIEPQRDAHPHGPGPAREHVHLKVRDSF